MPGKDEWRRLQRRPLKSRGINRRFRNVEAATTRHAHRFILKRVESLRNAQRQIVTWLAVMIGLIVSAGLQQGWFEQTYTTAAPAPGGVYAEGVPGSLKTLNPLYAGSQAELAAERLIFSSLYRYDVSGHLRGDLAQDITVDPTGKIYTVTLKPGVKWHDGRRLTADDIVYTLSVIKNPSARVAQTLSINWRDIRVSRIDDDRVRFDLPAAYAPFPHALTFPVLPEHILKHVAVGSLSENIFSREPIGSGPFRFVSLQQAVGPAGNHRILSLEPNELYYFGRPQLGRFELHTYQSEADIARSLSAGEIMAGTLLPSQKDKVDTQRYAFRQKPVTSGVYALFNTTSPTLDKNVRLALQRATDTERVRQAVGGDLPPLSLPFTDEQIDSSLLPNPPANSTREAAALLDKAGWKLEGELRQKKGQKLTINLTAADNDQYQAAVNELARQWRQLGITVETHLIDRNNPSVNFAQTILLPRSYDVLVSELQLGADPDVYSYWHSSQAAPNPNGYNFSNYRDDDADTLLVSARAANDKKLRDVKYAAFAQQWLKDAPAIGLFQNATLYAYNKNARTFSRDAVLITPLDRYADVNDWSVRTREVYKTP